MTDYSINPTLKTIFARKSMPVMTDEPLDKSLVNLIVQAGDRANDHGKLKPWRTLVFSGDDRERLSEAFIAHEKALGDAARLEKAARLPFRAPVVVCVVASPLSDRIVKQDQLFCAAAACQLMTLAAFSLDVASMWRTGIYATSEVVKEQLGLAANESVIGYIYLGWPRI